MFQHILDNRSSYNLLFGEENVNRSISIMVNMRLYQAFPRPDQEEALFLFELLDKEVAEMAMYKYMLNRYQEEENYEAYVAIAEEYISNIDANDFEVINNLSRHYEYSSSNLDLNQVIDLMEHAIEVQGGTYYRLYDTLAALYFKKGKKKKAMANVEKALELAENSGTDLTEMLQLKSLISGL